MKPFEMHVHPVIRERIQEPALTDLARDLLMELDCLLSSELSARKHTLIRSFQDHQGNPVTIKLVVARGSGRDAVHVTVPKPLTTRTTAPCKSCEQTGYANTETLSLCPQCIGLGYLVGSSDPAPL